MSGKLEWQTVSESLAGILKELMQIRELSAFRLVGGTSLGLQLGHGESSDIDLFTDQEYGSVDFKEIDGLLRESFKYVSEDHTGNFSVGIMRLVGNSDTHFVKVDLFYTDPFIREYIENEGIRMASVEDIAAKKLEVISTGGRKRDFWDIHELLDVNGITGLLDFFKERNPYLELDDVINGFTNFERADQEDDPHCLRGKYWELIRYDLEEVVNKYRAAN